MIPHKAPRPATARRFRLGDWISAPEWMSVGEAVQLSGYNTEYLRRTICQGKINAEKRRGRDLWIDKASVREYVEHMKSLGADKHNPHRNGG